MKKKPTVPLVLDATGDYSSENIRQALPKFSSFQQALRRSYIRALPMLPLGGIFFWIIWSCRPWLVASGIVPDQTLPSSVFALITFQLAGACTMLFSSARNFGTMATNAFSQFTGSLEALTCMVLREPDEIKRNKGLDLLRFLAASIVLYAADVPFIVKYGKRDDEQGEESYYDPLLELLGEWADEVKNVAMILGARGGIITWTLARGQLNIVKRFGLRKGLLVMCVLYFIVDFALLSLEFCYLNSLIFGAVIMSLSAYLMMVMLCVAVNEATPLLEMSGSGEIGPEKRLDRFEKKIEAQRRVKDKKSAS